MKTRNTYRVLIAILCIAAVLLAGILVFHTIQRGGRTIIRNMEDQGLYELCYDESFDTAFTEVNLKSNAGDMDVVQSSDGKVHLKIWADEKEVKVSEVGSVLNVTANAKGKVSIGINTYNRRMTKIELALPSDFSGEIRVKSQYGNLALAALPEAKLQLESEYGNLTAEALASLSAECDYGNVTVGALTDKISIKAEYGNVEIKTLTLREDGSIECEAGNIDIGSAQNIFIESETEVGTAKIRPNPSSFTATLYVETEVGNITVR